MENSECKNGQGCGTFVLLGRYSADLRPVSVALKCCYESTFQQDYELIYCTYWIAFKKLKKKKKAL